jgi:transposase
VSNILNLRNWDVTNVTETPGQYVIDATCKTLPPGCVHCGSVTNVHKHGTRKQEVVDLPSHGNRVRIALTRTRHWCKDCGKTFLQPLPDVAESGSMTRRLQAYIERQSVKHTFAHVAAEVGVDEKTVRTIFKAYTNWLDGAVRFETPTVLGLDELYLLKKPRCIATNIEKRTIIALLEDRNKPTVTQYLFWLPDKERVKVVTMDMWKPYRDAVQKVLPDAAIVVDKFHIVRVATKAMETIRRGLKDAMTTTKRREVMRSRFLLLRRARTLDAEEQKTVAEWSQNLPTLGMAYKLKEGFYSIFELRDRASAEAAYKAWKESIPDEMQKPFKEVTTAMTNWEKEVFNYFDHRFTNATTEALNGLSKITNRTGRGYSFSAVRAKMLYGRYLHTIPEHVRHPDLPPGSHGYFVPPNELIPISRDEGHLFTEPNYGADIETLRDVLVNAVVARPAAVPRVFTAVFA